MQGSAFQLIRGGCEWTNDFDPEPAHRRVPGAGYPPRSADHASAERTGPNGRIGWLAADG
jgi:hypothetical protein